MRHPGGRRSLPALTFDDAVTREGRLRRPLPAKAGNLARLRALGFPTPEGLVILPGALRSHLRTRDARSLMRYAHSRRHWPADDERQSWEAVRLAIRMAPVAGELRDGVAQLARGLWGRDWPPLAVRSAAGHEDSARHSFAGAYHTSLDVRGETALWEAVRRCWASLFAPPGLAAGRAAGLDPRRTEMAVIIQRYVPSEAAGVASQSQSDGGGATLEIAASGPLGSVVAGTEVVDRYRLQEGRVVVSEPAGETPLLSDAQLRELAELLAPLGNHFDGPQDAEWVLADGRFQLVQTRPITTGAPGADSATKEPVEHPWGDALWTSANVGEILPEVVTPLTASIMCTVLNSSFLRSFRRLLPALPWDTPFLRRHQGRLYLNAATMQWIAWQALGSPPAESNQALGGLQPTAFEPAAPSLIQRVARSALGVAAGAGLTVATFTAPRRYAALEAVLARRPVEFDGLTDLELLHILFAYRAPAQRVMLPFLDVSSASNAFLGLLRKKCEQWLPHCEGLALRLVRGVGNITSADHALRLRELAEAARSEPRAMAFFERYRNGARAADPGSLAGADWREALGDGITRNLAEEFLVEYGHRAIREVELAEPRWSEDPSFLWQEVATLLAEPPPTGNARPGADEAWTTAKEALRQRSVTLAPLRLTALRGLAGLYARAARQREAGKSVLVKLLAYRPWMLEAGRRLTAHGLLHCPDDVFYLERAELIEALLGEIDDPALPAIVMERKRELARWAKMEAPEFFFGETPGDARPPAVAPDGPLTGLAVSGGIAKGPVRVLRSPAEGYRLRHGDVLVATHADPAWTPLFLRAAALVLEKGGMLSHSSIVAREYGLPAVTNIAGVTRLLSEGAEVVVDGNAGRVTVVEGDG